MLTLILKGVFCLLASFLLMATTTIEAICRALRQLHVPKLLTNLLLLTFRYVGLLLSEVAVMQQAYSLRAPGQKGIHISAWGSFLGQLLLRSMDRAQALYESMELRGFCGEFPGAARGRGSAASWPYALVCPALMLLARYFDLSALYGRTVCLRREALMLVFDHVSVFYGGTQVLRGFRFPFGTVNRSACSARTARESPRL